MIPHWKQKFALLWTGQALSILSSMISQYALIWYLTDLTGSPAVLSLATMAALVSQGIPVTYKHHRAHETQADIVSRIQL